MFTRRNMIKFTVSTVIAVLTSTLLSPRKAQAGAGECSQCSCPSYSGTGYTCETGGCGHHYSQHW